MVDFSVPDDVRMITQALRDFVEKEVRPVERKLAPLLADERHMLTEEGLLVPQVASAVAALRKKSADAGYYAMHMPEAVGGGGVSKVGMYLAWREVMRAGLGLNFGILSFVEGPSPLFLRMNEQQQAKWLLPLVRGEKTSAFCLTEPQAGSDVSKLQATATRNPTDAAASVSRVRTEAEREGDEYVLNGTKTFVTNGPYADFLQVFARTGGEGLGALSCFIVPTDAPGVRRGAIQQSILNDGGQCEWIFDNAVIPVENRVGEEGEGFSLAIGNIADTRVTIGGQCVGLADFALERAVDYAKQREAFGKPIGKQGQIQAMIADSAIDIACADNLILRTCWMIDNDMDVMRESSMVKVFATEMLFRVADRAIQVHGGNGLMRELPLERVFRFARLVRIPEGTSEIQRWTIAKTYGL